MSIVFGECSRGDAGWQESEIADFVQALGQNVQAEPAQEFHCLQPLGAHLAPSRMVFEAEGHLAVLEVEFGWAKRIREAHAPTGRHIGDFTKWKEHDAYQRAFARLLRDLKPGNATNPS